jgi:hypothetical protein
MEYKQSDFCKTYGLEPSTISKAIKRGAIVKNTAGLIDEENATKKIFLAKHHPKALTEDLRDDGKNAERTIKKAIDFTALEEWEISDHAGLPKRLLGMTIRELVIKFKGMDGIERYVKMLRDLAAADEKDQKTQERRLQLVEKDFVISRVFQYLDVLMKQLLEWPGGAVDGIVALILSQGEAARNEVIKEMEKGITNIIKDAKNQVIKEFSGLRAKYQDDDKLDEVKAVIEEAINN